MDSVIHIWTTGACSCRNPILSFFLNTSRSLIIHFLMSMMQSHITFITIISRHVWTVRQVQLRIIGVTLHGLHTLQLSSSYFVESRLVAGVYRNRSGPRQDPCVKPCTSGKVSEIWFRLTGILKSKLTSCRYSLSLFTFSTLLAEVLS